jgi:hypothetical protein
MKFSAITLLALQAITIGFVGVLAEDGAIIQEDAGFWKQLVNEVDSFPTPPPTPGPTPPPTPAPTPGPTAPPIPGPTPPPSPAPTPGPTPPPTPGPTPPPSPAPTPGPTAPPTPGPTPPPTPGPTPPPTPGPTPPPTPFPTLAPTGECSIDSCVNCTTIMNNEEIACEDIPQEDKPVCSCPDCVRDVRFVYTGLACSPAFSASGKCADEGPNPFIAGYRITSCDDPTAVFASGEAQQGDSITIAAGGTSCLPECLSATISVPTGQVTQTFEIDSECAGGNGLILISNYGSFESVGYSCDETDVHNCIQSISYGLKVCNTGTTEEQIFDWFLTINEEEIDLLEDVPPADVTLVPGECYYDTYDVDVDRCVAQESCVNITANATNPETGLPPNCPGLDDLKFAWDSPPAPPPTPNPR